MDAQDRPSGDIFEALWLLRACYALRSDYDAIGTLSVRGAIDYGEQLMRIQHLRERWSGFGRTHRTA